MFYEFLMSMGPNHSFHYVLPHDDQAGSYFTKDIMIADPAVTDYTKICGYRDYGTKLNPYSA